MCAGRGAATAICVLADVNDVTLQNSTSAYCWRQLLGPGGESGWCSASPESVSVALPRQCKRVLKP